MADTDRDTLRTGDKRLIPLCLRCGYRTLPPVDWTQDQIDRDYAGHHCPDPPRKGRMAIIVDVVGANPALTDPHEVAEDLVLDYNECRPGTFRVSFVAAEWLS